MIQRERDLYLTAYYTVPLREFVLLPFTLGSMVIVIHVSQRYLKKAMPHISYTILLHVQKLYTFK